MRLLLLLLLVPLVAAQEPAAGPGIAIIVHHPHPDAYDPFGIPAGETDTFMARAGHLKKGAFEFPSLVVDGIRLVEGIPEGDPQQATYAAYRDAVAARPDKAPLTLSLASSENGRVRVVSVPNGPLGEGLRVGLALVEDPVDYRPPAAVSNGVFLHPFTLRALTDVTFAEQVDHHFELDEDWVPENLFVVAWVQQGASFGRFDAHEVLTATMHPMLRPGWTEQTTKGVLVEAYSATWCDPCLFGDRAVERLAIEHDVPVARDDAASGYFRPVAWWIVGLAAVIGWWARR